MLLTLTKTDLKDSEQKEPRFNDFNPDVRAAIKLIGKGVFNGKEIFPFDLTPNQLSMLVNWIGRAYPLAHGTIEIESIVGGLCDFTWEDPKLRRTYCQVEYRAVGDILEDVKIDGVYPPKEEQ